MEAPSQRRRRARRRRPGGDRAGRLLRPFLLLLVLAALVIAAGAVWHGPSAAPQWSVASGTLPPATVTHTVGAAPAPTASEAAASEAAAAGAPGATTVGGRVYAKSHKPVPILMYHEIGQPSGPWPQLFVKADDFAAQLAYLANHGYTTLTVSQVLDAWEGRRAMPAKPVAITFDDGYYHALATALPLLRADHQHATLFLEVNLLDQPYAATAAQVRRWVADGNELGSHTFSHPDLRTVDHDRLVKEVSGSRTFLAQRFGVVIRTFAYPSGDYSQAVVGAVRDAGYDGAVTTHSGVATPAGNRLELPRVRINRSDGLKGFAAKLAHAAAARQTSERAP